MSKNNEIKIEEQKIIDNIYSVLDKNKLELRKKIKALNSTNFGSTHQNKSEKDSIVFTYFDQLAKLNSVDRKLIFGKLVYEDGEERYIGRIGLFDSENNPVLYDWRTKIAEDFYQATAINSNKVSLRRHINIANRKITSFEDEYLDGSETSTTTKAKVSDKGDNAIFHALKNKRSSRMNDIVSTIQKEQDVIIRNDTKSLLVVQGGAGTGKTAVALHRTAYLLYNNRKRLEKSGVLLIGPNEQFLYYIDQVLPSLGETGVVSTSINKLFPGVKATFEEPYQGQIIKGDIRMKDAIKQAVEMFIRLPEETVSFQFREHTVEISRNDVKACQTFAKNNKLNHNKGRLLFVRSLLDILSQKYFLARRAEATGPDEIKEVKAGMLRENVVARTLNYCWMPLEPKRLIKDMFNSKDLLSGLLPWATDEAISESLREPDQEFSKFDIPLLFVATELIGQTKNDSAEATSEDAKNSEDMKQTIETLNLGNQFNTDLLFELESSGQSNEVNTKLNDLFWTYGHVIVDEAQEMSQMDWYLLSRKCPTHSFTIVGDVMQTSSPAGSRNWHEALDSTFGSDFPIEKLTVNYRNPKEVADKALEVLEGQGIEIEPITAPRSVENSYRVHKVEPNKLYDTAADIAYEMIQEFVDFNKAGKVAVIVRAKKVYELKNAIYDKLELDHGSIFLEPIRTQKPPMTQLDVITPEFSKGLEYDAVLLVEPKNLEVSDGTGLTKESISNLYVAMTRPTSRLEVVHSKELPQGF
jgi:DNA helicase IV